MPIQSLESLVDNLDQLPNLFSELKSNKTFKSDSEVDTSNQLVKQADKILNQLKSFDSNQSTSLSNSSNNLISKSELVTKSSNHNSNKSNVTTSQDIKKLATHAKIIKDKLTHLLTDDSHLSIHNNTLSESKSKPLLINPFDRHRKSHKTIKQLFKNYDTNHTGKISYQDFHNILVLSSSGLSQSDIDKVTVLLDDSGVPRSGFIDYNHIMSNLNKAEELNTLYQLNSTFTSSVAAVNSSTAAAAAAAAGTAIDREQSGDSNSNSSIAMKHTANQHSAQQQQQQQHEHTVSESTATSHTDEHTQHTNLPPSSLRLADYVLNNPHNTADTAHTTTDLRQAMFGDDKQTAVVPVAPTAGTGTGTSVGTGTGTGVVRRSIQFYDNDTKAVTTDTRTATSGGSDTGDSGRSTAAVAVVTSGASGQQTPQQPQSPVYPKTQGKRLHLQHVATESDYDAQGTPSADSTAHSDWSRGANTYTNVYNAKYITTSNSYGNKYNGSSDNNNDSTNASGNNSNSGKYDHIYNSNNNGTNSNREMTPLQQHARVYDNTRSTTPSKEFDIHSTQLPRRRHSFSHTHAHTQPHHSQSYSLSLPQSQSSNQCHVTPNRIYDNFNNEHSSTDYDLFYNSHRRHINTPSLMQGELNGTLSARDNREYFNNPKHLTRRYIQATSNQKRKIVYNTHDDSIKYDIKLSNAPYYIDTTLHTNKGDISATKEEINEIEKYYKLLNKTGKKVTYSQPLTVYKLIQGGGNRSAGGSGAGDTDDDTPLTSHTGKRTEYSQRTALSSHTLHGILHKDEAAVHQLKNNFISVTQDVFTKAAVTAATGATDTSGNSGTSSSNKLSNGPTYYKVGGSLGYKQRTQTSTLTDPLPSEVWHALMHKNNKYSNRRTIRQTPFYQEDYYADPIVNDAVMGESLCLSDTGLLDDEKKKLNSSSRSVSGKRLYVTDTAPVVLTHPATSTYKPTYTNIASMTRRPESLFHEDEDQDLGRSIKYRKKRSVSAPPLCRTVTQPVAITESEFQESKLALINQIPSSLNNLRYQLKKCDKSGSGVLNYLEFKRALQGAGVAIQPKQIESIFATISSNNNNNSNSSGSGNNSDNNSTQQHQQRQQQSVAIADIQTSLDHRSHVNKHMNIESFLSSLSLPSSTSFSSSVAVASASASVAATSNNSNSNTNSSNNIINNNDNNINTDNNNLYHSFYHIINDSKPSKTTTQPINTKLQQKSQSFTENEENRVMEKFLRATNKQTDPLKVFYDINKIKNEFQQTAAETSNNNSNSNNSSNNIMSNQYSSLYTTNTNTNTSNSNNSNSNSSNSDINFMSMNTIKEGLTYIGVSLNDSECKHLLNKMNKLRSVRKIHETAGGVGNHERSQSQTGVGNFSNTAVDQTGVGSSTKYHVGELHDALKEQVEVNNILKYHQHHHHPATTASAAASAFSGDECTDSGVTTIDSGASTTTVTGTTPGQSQSQSQSLASLIKSSTSSLVQQGKYNNQNNSSYSIHSLLHTDTSEYPASFNSQTYMDDRKKWTKLQSNLSHYSKEIGLLFKPENDQKRPKYPKLSKNGHSTTTTAATTTNNNSGSTNSERVYDSGNELYRAMQSSGIQLAHDDFQRLHHKLLANTSTDTNNNTTTNNSDNNNVNTSPNKQSISLKQFCQTIGMNNNHINTAANATATYTSQTDADGGIFAGATRTVSLDAQQYIHQQQQHPHNNTYSNNSNSSSSSNIPVPVYAHKYNPSHLTTMFTQPMEKTNSISGQMKRSVSCSSLRPTTSSVSTSGTTATSSNSGMLLESVERGDACLTDTGRVQPPPPSSLSYTPASEFWKLEHHIENKEACLYPQYNYRDNRRAQPYTDHGQAFTQLKPSFTVKDLSLSATANLANQSTFMYTNGGINRRDDLNNSLNNSMNFNAREPMHGPTNISAKTMTTSATSVTTAASNKTPVKNYTNSSAMSALLTQSPSATVRHQSPAVRQVSDDQMRLIKQSKWTSPSVYSSHLLGSGGSVTGGSGSSKAGVYTSLMSPIPYVSDSPAAQSQSRRARTPLSTTHQRSRTPFATDFD